MKLFPLGLILFGTIIILKPEIVAYLIGGLFVFIGMNLLVFNGMFQFWKKSTGEKDDYIKVGKYKIYR